MASKSTHYRVLLAAYFGPGKLDHHAIFVDTQKGLGGQLFHVVGSVQVGMEFQTKENGDPLGTPTCTSTQQIGWVSHGNFDKIKPICEMIPPPEKQWKLSELLVPRDQLRLNPHWVAEAVHALRKEEILEELGPGDDGRVILNFAANHDGEDVGDNGNHIANHIVNHIANHGGEDVGDNHNHIGGGVGGNYNHIGGGAGDNHIGGGVGGNHNANHAANHDGEDVGDNHNHNGE